MAKNNVVNVQKRIAIYQEVEGLIEKDESLSARKLLHERGERPQGFYNWRLRSKKADSNDAGDVDVALVVHDATATIEAPANSARKYVRTAKVRTPEAPAKCVVIVTDVSQLANILKGL